MTPAIWRWFERLETQKQKVLTDVAGLSAAQLRFRPEPHRWSVPDVLDHLIKVEKALLEAVQDRSGPPALRLEAGGASERGQDPPSRS